jgi:hypothetical protein
MEIGVKNHADAMIFHTLVVPQAAQHSLMADVKSHSRFYVATSSGKKRLRNGD